METTEKRSDGILLKMCGREFTVRPPVIPDAYARIMVVLEGLGPIAGPTAPNLDAYMAMLEARLKAGKITPEVYQRLLLEARGKQVERMKSDADGNAAGDIADEVVEATLNTFARDAEGFVGLQSYAFRAALRECFQNSGYWKENPGSRDRFRHGTGIWPLFIRLERGDQPIKDTELYIESGNAFVKDADEIKSQPVHVWAAGKQQHSISQFEVIEAPWRARIMIEMARNLYVEPGTVEAGAAEPGTAETEPEHKDGKKSKSKEKPKKPAMKQITPEDIVRVLQLMPTVAWGAKRSMGFGRCKVIGVSDVMYDAKDTYPMSWKDVRVA